MANNHQPQETSVPLLPIYNNETGNSNRKLNHWPTIILWIVFVITGQSIAKLLENFLYDKTNCQNYGVWTDQSLLRNVGFPLLLVPFFITKKHNQQQQPPITSGPSSIRYIISQSVWLGLLLENQVGYSAEAKLESPFRAFTRICTTLLFFTWIFATFINKIKFNRWIVISLILAIATGALTFGSELDKADEKYTKGLWSALFSGLHFSLILALIQEVCKRNESTTKKPNFASLLELMIFSSLFVTVFSGLGFYGERNEFSKGKGTYVMAMVGKAVSWQVYWVGIVGLVFSVSSVLSNVIIITWPIVSVLVVILFNIKEDEIDVFKGVALITAVLSATSYFYMLHKENRESEVVENYVQSLED